VKSSDTCESGQSPQPASEETSESIHTSKRAQTPTSENTNRQQTYKPANTTQTEREGGRHRMREQEKGTTSIRETGEEENLIEVGAEWCGDSQ